MKPNSSSHKLSRMFVSISVTGNRSEPDSSERAKCISAAAYRKAEAHGFAPAPGISDWLEAEAEYGERMGVP